MNALSFDCHRVFTRYAIGFCALVIPAVLASACTPEERQYGSGGSGGSSSSSGSSSGGGEGGTSSSSSSSSGNPVNPGDIINSQYFANDTALLFDLAVDAKGNSLLVGRFSGVLDFGDGALVDVGGGDMFIARHDQKDKLIFSKSYGSPGNAGIVRGTVSPKGTIFAAGDISDMTAMNFGKDALQGPGVWQVALGEVGSPVIYDNIVPSGMSYLSPYGVAGTTTDAAVFVGFYGGTISFGQTMLTSAGDSDGYVVKFDPTGAVAWSRGVGGTGHDNISGIKTDPNDNNYIVGYFTDTMMLAGGVTLTSFGGSDIFVAKMGPAGLPKWIRQIGGVAEEFIFGTLGVAPNGDVVVAGSANDVISAEGTMLPAAGGADVFIAKYSTDGTLSWAKRYGDAGSQNIDSLAVDPAGNILLTGTFDGNIDFGAGPVAAPPGGGAYLAKLDPMGKPIFTRVISGQMGALRVAPDGVASILFAGTGSNVSFELGTSNLPTGGVFLVRVAP